MALREIRLDGDPVLRKRAREVTSFDDRLHTLLEDMAETMYEASGVGLAAPQVGVRKRVVVIDVGEGVIELINPTIVETEGQQCGAEGCLSVPERSGYVRRPMRVVVEAQDRDGESITLEGEEYLAVAINHELDHLDGVLFTDKVIEPTEEELAQIEARNRERFPDGEDEAEPDERETSSAKRAQEEGA